MRTFSTRARLLRVSILVLGLVGAVAASFTAGAAQPASAGQAGPPAAAYRDALPALPPLPIPPPSPLLAPGMAPQTESSDGCPGSSFFPSPILSTGVLYSFADISWHVCVSLTNGARTVWIGPVRMFRQSTGTWELVLERAGLAEVFTATHNGNVRGYTLGTFIGVGAQHAGPHGFLLQLQDSGDPQAYYPYVVAEIRYRGVAWLCKQASAATRRSWELVVWGISDAGNDDNIVEYSFRDDGAITFRVGHGGYNDPYNAAEPHTHSALWYVRPGMPQSAYWLTHAEPNAPAAPNVARDFQTPIAVEGARQWNEREFASLLLEGNVVNAFGNRRGYEFSPLPNVLSRHFGALEAWTRNDVYLARSRPTELGWITSRATPDTYLLPLLDGESIVNENLAVWIKTAAHHHPTDEDRSSVAFHATTGIPLVRWSGFRMEPHNLFEANPMGGPARCGR